MSAFLTDIFEGFWNEKFWLPENSTWDAFQNTKENVYYPQLRDIMLSIPTAFILHFVRIVVERYIWKPIGISFGIKDVAVQAYTPNRRLEKLYKKDRRPDHKKMILIAEENNKSVREVEFWFHRRRNFEKSSVLKKFCESGWRFMFYTSVFWGGVYILYGRDWVTDLRLCFRGHPYHHVPREIYYYYIIELAYYWASIIQIFGDTKRKDFWEMFCHHICTVSLMFFSWTTNFIRIGSLIVCIHDAVDYWMEAAKLARYVKKSFVCDTCFIIFTLVWIVSRLTIFPFWLLHAVFVVLPAEINDYPALNGFKAFLIMLQILHIIWFYLISRIIAQVLKYGEVQNDSRSDSEMSESEDENDNEKKK